MPSTPSSLRVLHSQHFTTSPLLSGVLTLPEFRARKDDQAACGGGFIVYPLSPSIYPPPRALIDTRRLTVAKLWRRNSCCVATRAYRSLNLEARKNFHNPQGFAILLFPASVYVFTPSLSLLSFIFSFYSFYSIISCFFFYSFLVSTFLILFQLFCLFIHYFFLALPHARFKTS